jgi:hypothetical protein
MRIGNTASPAKILPILISILPGFGAHFTRACWSAGCRATFIISHPAGHFSIYVRQRTEPLRGKDDDGN